MSSDLDRLKQFGISTTQIQVLRWFRQNQGAMPTNSTLRGTKGSAKVPADKFVKSPHYKISPRKAAYVPAGGDFVQSIVVSKEESTVGRYSGEVKFDGAGRWYQVDYNHTTDGQYKDIQKLENCHQNKVPIGIAHKLQKGVNEILGLGIITEMSKQCKLRECKLHNKSPYPVGRCKHFLYYKIEPYDKQKLPPAEERVVAKITRQIEKKDYSSKGKETTVKVRRFGDYFKRMLMIQYDSRCAFCNMGTFSHSGGAQPLVGAHIVPKAVMDKYDPKNAMNPVDGLLLCELCDIAFEYGHITVDAKYRISISNNLRQKANEKANKVLKSWIKNIRKKISLKKNSPHNPKTKYLKKKMKLIKKMQNSNA